MSRTAKPVDFVCRLCRQHLKQAFKQDSHQKRSFSSTTIKSRTIPSFQPTSSPELDALLLDYRRRVFTPAALSQTHRRLIRRGSNHELLKTDPGITITLSDDEDVKLEPQHDWDRPKRRQTLHLLARLLEDNNDDKTWRILMPFLEAMKMAKEPLHAGWLERITRKANEQGRWGLIIQAARSAKDTNMRLSSPGVTRELMLGFHNRVIESDYESGVLMKAFHQATAVARLLESEEHCGSKLSASSIDMRRDVTVMGVLLELSAADTIYYHKNKAGNEVVRDYAIKTLALMEGMSLEPGQLTGKEQEWTLLGHFIEAHVPLWNGIRLTQRVQGIEKTTRGALEDVQKRLTGSMNRAYSEVKKEASDKPRRSLKMFEAVKK